jgi:hypothetical protein
MNSPHDRPIKPRITFDEALAQNKYNTDIADPTLPRP